MITRLLFICALCVSAVHAQTYGDLVAARKAGRVLSPPRETVRTVISTSTSNALVRVAHPDGRVTTNLVAFVAIPRAAIVAADVHADRAIAAEEKAFLAAWQRARERDVVSTGSAATPEKRQAEAAALKADRLELEKGSDPLAPISTEAGAAAAVATAIVAGVGGVIAGKRL
jgi:hypothetical protein